MKGKFVSIEGCEGVGKSTQIELLKKYTKQYNIDAVFVREPGGTVISEKIRSIILDINNSRMDEITELLLYEAARRQLVREVISPSIESGKIVFCDRFIDSTMSYQGYARGIDKSLIERLNSLAAEGLYIDATIFLDAPSSLGFRRKGGADKNDRLEQESEQFHKRVYDGFCDLKRLPRFISVDARLSILEVHKSIINELSKINILNGEGL